ncbi:MAG TPA: hypothetical protein DDW67_03530, partial [Elusimicrobia bacterium]|nr:hypothetical protein [Elusimicrobiota bacterium]
MTDARSRLSSLAGIAARFGLKALESQVKACESLLSAGAAINAAVLGKFKAGKSSFLNSLAGTGVLPAGALPVTAVVTELFWSPEETASVRVVGGETLPISLEQVPDYVSEELNPKNARGAAAVSLGLPALADYKGVRFVDTPGLDSALRHNTETSLDWLPNAGLAIVAVSSDAPLSEQDLALISRTRRHSPSITVLLTKADRLEPAELDRVLGFVRGRLRERFGADFGVYPYSVKDGFGAMRAEFRDKVLLPFAGGLASEKARILEHKLGSLERQCRDYLLAARAAAAKSAGER